MVHPIVWCHGAPADDAGGGGGGEGDDVGCCYGRGRGGVEEVFSADTEHDYEGYYVGDPGYGFVSEVDEDSYILFLSYWKGRGTDLCMMLYPQKVIYEKRGVS